ncbi:MAG: sigma-70 family RNA polymerase sigma factor [Treponema sp.]|nr:sigma-70 family RNA polymerase sigma factor [Treponema sp.]
MEDIEGLRRNLVSYVKKKFYSRRNIVDMADEIVNQAFLDVAKSVRFNNEQYNFGYMSVACIRTAYKVFHKNDNDKKITVCFDLTSPLVDEDSFTEEIENADDTAFIFESLQTLKQIERVIISERYYKDFSFREISEKYDINLNTVLSHHRRALEKLRPVLSNYFNYNISGFHYGKSKPGGKND